MDSDPSATRPHSQQNIPPPAMRGYSGPLPGPGYPPHSDYLHHPLHRVYRTKIRGVRVVWFVTGMVLGGIFALALIILLSALAFKAIPKIVHDFTGEPAVTLSITEDYLNSQAQKRLGDGFRPINSSLVLLAVGVGIAPENRIDYQANFHLNVPFISADVSAFVKNQINVKDGKVVINMVGDPQLGNLNLPLESLPFNLKDEINRAVDGVNNGLVGTEINKMVESSLGSTDLFLDGITTDDSSITLRLRQK